MKEFTCSFIAFEDVFRKGCVLKRKRERKRKMWGD